MLRRRRPTAAERRTKEERDQYRDRRGISFHHYHLWLPSSTHDWPSPPRRKDDDADAQGDFHRQFNNCWWCDRVQAPSWYVPDKRGFMTICKLELHHLAEGSRGKAQERELFTMLCSDCHDKHDNPDDLGRLLWLKWKMDPEWTDWTWLALRLRRFLPPLITERPE